MARLESVLPALREGKKVRRQRWDKGAFLFVNGKSVTCERYAPFFLSGEILFATDWEIVPEPTRVADYLVKNEFYRTTAKGISWFRETHPIGQQPEGSVMVPGSEREVTE